LAGIVVQAKLEDLFIGDGIPPAKVTIDAHGGHVLAVGRDGHVADHTLMPSKHRLRDSGQGVDYLKAMIRASRDQRAIVSGEGDRCKKPT